MENEVDFGKALLCSFQIGCTIAGSKNYTILEIRIRELPTFINMGARTLGATNAAKSGNWH